MLLFFEDSIIRLVPAFCAAHQQRIRTCIFFRSLCSEWKAVMERSVVLGGVLCYGTGLMGYMAFRDATEGDILDNFYGIVATCFKVLVVLHLVMYIPNEVRKRVHRKWESCNG